MWGARSRLASRLTSSRLKPLLSKSSSARSAVSQVSNVPMTVRPIIGPPDYSTPEAGGRFTGTAGKLGGLRSFDPPPDHLVSLELALDVQARPNENPRVRRELA